MRHGSVFLPNIAEVAPHVLQAMARQPISNRSTEFHAIFATIQAGLRGVFRTVRPIYIATESGTGMMEAAIRCAPRGRIMSLVSGAFGERFVRIANACDRRVDRHVLPPGDAPAPEVVRGLLASASYSALTVVHSETSTGALADIRAIAEVAREAGVMTIVDSVSGIGGACLEFDAWGLDCVVSASQKALGLPPGLAFAVTSERFLAAAAKTEGRGVYLDLVAFDEHARNHETPTTPCVPLFFALEEQVAEFRREGMEARWARHEAMRQTMESWVAKTGSLLNMELGILAKRGMRSPTVTVVTLPTGVSADRLLSGIAARGFLVGTGYGALGESTIRVGHMGSHTVRELERCLGAVREALDDTRESVSSR